MVSSLPIVGDDHTLSGEANKTPAKPRRERERIDGLTPSQACFCKLIFAGYSGADAYRIAYGHPNIKAATASERAWRLKNHPAVREHLAQGKRAEELKVLLTVNDRLRILAEMVQSNKVRPNDKIRALEAYTKLAGGAAPERVEITGANGGPIAQAIEQKMEIAVLPVRERLARFKQAHQLTPEPLPQASTPAPRS